MRWLVLTLPLLLGTECNGNCPREDATAVVTVDGGVPDGECDPSSATDSLNLCPVLEKFKLYFCVRRDVPDEIACYYVKKCE